MSIEVQQQLDEVETTPPVEVGVSSKVGDVDVVNTIEVTAYVPKYTICGDDIYIAQYTTEPPLWLTDLIEYKTSTSQLANDVDDLEDSFQNFQDGYTQQIAYLQNQNNAMAFDISTLKVSNNTNVAGIQRLDSTKITASDAEAIATATIGAWSNTTGGAWFDSKISTVSNVAYSAARSAANLTAVMNSQQDQLLAIVGDVSTLQKQVDGKVETWFGLQSPVLGDGSVDVTVEPYATWLANDELEVHTGDSYIHYELDLSGNKVILGTYKFVYDTDIDTYQWSLFSDDLASEAYNRALQAQDTADSKIVTYYQTFPPTGASLGDLWLDSDDSDKLYRYNGTNWVAVDDKRIQASVQRLDEATVTVDGTARAKSSLKVDANGVVSGYVAESGSTSKFKIYADEFSIARYDNGQEVGNPFVVDTTTNKIKFTGSVSFAGTAVDTALQQGDAANDINNGTTTIDGGKITTGSIDANKIRVNSLTVDTLDFSTQENRNAFASKIGDTLLEYTDFMQDFFALANKGSSAEIRPLTWNGTRYLDDFLMARIYRDNNVLYIYVYGATDKGSDMGGTLYTSYVNDSEKSRSKNIRIDFAATNNQSFGVRTNTTVTFSDFNSIPLQSSAIVKTLYRENSGASYVTAEYSIFGFIVFESLNKSIITYDSVNGGMATKIGKEYNVIVPANSGAVSVQLPIGVYQVKPLSSAVSVQYSCGYDANGYYVCHTGSSKYPMVAKDYQREYPQDFPEMYSESFTVDKDVLRTIYVKFSVVKVIKQNFGLPTIYENYVGTATSNVTVTLIKVG